MAWRLWKRQGRKRTNSRPRVALAAEAARSAQTEMSGGYRAQLGSSWAGANLLLAVDSGARGVGRGGGPQGAVVAASPALLLATARASNRAVEDVWEEALTAWIAGGSEPRHPRPAGQTAERRYHVWREIDQTLGALRAG